MPDVLSPRTNTCTIGSKAEEANEKQEEKDAKESEGEGGDDLPNLERAGTYIVHPEFVLEGEDEDVKTETTQRKSNYERKRSYSLFSSPSALFSLPSAAIASAHSAAAVTAVNGKCMHIRTHTRTHTHTHTLTHTHTCINPYIHI